MKSPACPTLGFVPSAELLPWFENAFHSRLAVRLVPRSSYGRIAREMLTGQLAGGFLPWEIFVADVLSLPGERTHWQVSLFLQSCPTELVLRAATHRSFHSAKPVSAKTVPRLVIGVESRNSLTRHQFLNWLAEHSDQRAPEVAFRMLPMDLMVQGLQAEVIDGFVAPAPWGSLAEKQGLGKIVSAFEPGRMAQKLALVRRREQDEPIHANSDLAAQTTTARQSLRDLSALSEACDLMTKTGKPVICQPILLEAAQRYISVPVSGDSAPDATLITRELRNLEKLSALPPQIAANDQTARLLLT